MDVYLHISSPKGISMLIDSRQEHAGMTTLEHRNDKQEHRNEKLGTREWQAGSVRIPVFSPIKTYEDKI